MNITDTEGRNTQTFLRETFEYETCEECDGDVEDHDAPYFFARCKHAPEED